MKLCFATNNEHKLIEVKSLLGDAFTIVSLKEIGCFEELSETGGTLKENSLQKADYIAKKYDLDCFSDDTGLEVDILNKAPGVHSARYAGQQRNSEDNIWLLLHNLVNESNRKAQFKTVITLIKRGCTYFFEGTLDGAITREKRGQGGFGYDSLFVPTGYTISLAEMTLAKKNSISHRRRAMDKLLHFLKEDMGR